ncbi:ABC transporter substrate-binding protein [Chelatococcus asaccharovorans]|uniref:Peptide/nickel transport system substrate-binding protein n=1 Tax=Chelatococcus asaccharovorans TaxID=28210 RepID=A0A2V3U0P6_9HYPH|nr:ABC transporter substrate-binding protein [Chelatococcus asaccharovorans]MBS7707576.1 ABC transporter substrate-binding protein [Chelatococcus asaccharovorans]PXW55149.1 peptide/nickel transport system substrate-binding protein [Chelatococcus asaccharovorans]
MKMIKTTIAALGALLAVTATSQAEELKIGMRIEAVMDPHYFWSGNNVQYYRHYLGFLTTLDDEARVLPYLAERWETTDSSWTFHLRPNLTFSDGSTFDAEDVVASYKRARDYPNAVGSYAGLFNGVTAIEAVDKLTVKMTTAAPSPTLAFAMSQVPIIPSEIATTATQADFTSAKGSVSIGPYKFAGFASGRELVLERNPNFWGEKPKWDSVRFRFLPDPSARTAALLAGDVDMIDGVPPEFVERIRADANFAVHTGPSMRNVYVNLDQGHEVSPFITDNNGAPLKTNPLKDRRVREALSLAINRETIRDRVMNGLSFPTGQLVAKGLGGYSATLGVPAYDPNKAKTLLAEAGYPDGFKVTVHCPNDRYVNDAKICQALGQMFSRIGLRANVVTQPSSAYFKMVNPRTASGASIFLSSWSAAASGETDVLVHAFQTYNAEKKTGSWNYGGYSNPDLDALIGTFTVTTDDTKRRALEAKAMELTMKDFAALPLHDQSVVVATRKPLTYTTNLEELTNALAVR